MTTRATRSRSSGRSAAGSRPPLRNINIDISDTKARAITQAPQELHAPLARAASKKSGDGKKWTAAETERVAKAINAAVDAAEESPLPLEEARHLAELAAERG